MDAPRKRWWIGPRARWVLVWAALALVAALPACLKAVESGTLNVSCKGGAVTLEARDAPVADVLGALEKECGLLLEGKENLPEQSVTTTVQEVTLEEVLEILIELTDLPNILLSTAPSGALKLAVLATGPEAPPEAAEESATLEVNCEEGMVTLEARDAPVADVLGALEKECGLLLEGKENLPEQSVTTTVLQDVTLEEVLEVLIELTDLPNTLLATAPSGKLKLTVLPVGTSVPPEVAAEEGEEPEGLRASVVDQEAAVEAARRQFLLAQTDEERQRILEELKRLDIEEAEELIDKMEAQVEAAAAQQELLARTTDEHEERQQALAERVRALAELHQLDYEAAEDLAASLEEAAIEEAVRKFELAKTDEERQQALAELQQLKSEAADELAEDLAEELEEAAVAAARDQYLSAQTDEERQQALEELEQLDPEVAAKLQK